MTCTGRSQRGSCEMNFQDGEIDEILGWETGKSARLRRVYISRKAVVISAIERVRKRDKD